MDAQYRLPEALRAELAKPLGRLFVPAELAGRVFADAIERASLVVTVGDRVTETVGNLGKAPEVQIVDSRENRIPRNPPEVHFARSLSAANPAGSITLEAISRIKDAFAGEKPARVLIEGEEDLLAIPAIVLAPKLSSVFYGQPGQGIVLVTADDAAKGRSAALLRRMGIPDSVWAANR